MLYRLRANFFYSWRPSQIDRLFMTSSLDQVPFNLLF
jgi:hypothetical protein